ncbi:MAG: HEAT repeat domain-containing protein [Deltaproteobacteria bacterium]|nr:HEAT repeat domain-containing protein [Deltaproteobacteria bacterium]
MSDSPTAKRDAKSLINSILASTPDSSSNSQQTNTATEQNSTTSTSISSAAAPQNKTVEKTPQTTAETSSISTPTAAIDNTEEPLDDSSNEIDAAQLMTDDPDTLASDLIEVYFQSEEPEERDLIFDRLLTIDSPIVNEFLRAMMLEDEDDFMRSTAAVALAQNGDADAIAKLEEDLVSAEDSVFFANAIDGLSVVKGPEFYDTLKQMWQDPSRDADMQRQAMFGMDKVDSLKALDDFVTFINQIQDLNLLAEDQLEVAIMIFTRHEYKPGLQTLQVLHQRIDKAPELDDYAREGLLELVQEGINLLIE